MDHIYQMSRAAVLGGFLNVAGVGQVFAIRGAPSVQFTIRKGQGGE